MILRLQNTLKEEDYKETELFELILKPYIKAVKQDNYLEDTLDILIRKKLVETY